MSANDARAEWLGEALEPFSVLRFKKMFGGWGGTADRTKAIVIPAKAGTQFGAEIVSGRVCGAELGPGLRRDDEKRGRDGEQRQLK